MLNLDLLELFCSLYCLVTGFKKIQDTINILEAPLKDGVYFIHSLSLPRLYLELVHEMPSPLSCLQDRRGPITHIHPFPKIFNIIF